MTVHRLARALALAVVLALVMPGGALAASPVANDDSETVAEDAGATEFNVLSNDTDDDMDTLTIDGASDPAHGTVVVAGDDLSLTYEPDLNYHGSDAFSYTVSDGSDTDTADVEVTVTSVNDQPSAFNDSKSVAEDANATAMNVLNNDSDVDGDDITVTAVGNPPHGTTAITADGSNLTYRPDANYSGSDSFSYTISDTHLTDTATVTITVTASNDQPIAAPDSRTVGEDASATALNVLANDTDPDGDDVSISDVGTPSHGDAVVVGGGSDVTYRPDANYHGPDSFSYEIEDGNGGTDSAIVTVTVDAENDDPVADPDSASVAEDAPATPVPVLLGDTDVDLDVLVIQGASDPAHGTVVVASDDLTLTYRPDPNYFGPDPFTYTVSDGNGGSDTASVTVTVSSVNDNPVADADSITVVEDAAATGVPVLAGDSDIDGDVLTIEGASDPAHGTVVVAGNGLSLTYKPDPNYLGPDSFTYAVSDGNGGSDAASVTVTVTSVNDNPVTNSDSLSIPAGASPVPVPVLANDTDVDGDVLTIIGKTNGAKGVVTIGNGGTNLTYKPLTGLFGSDSFTYTIGDGHGGTAIGTVSVTITSGNHTPNAVNDARDVPQGAAATPLTILANDQDADGNNLTITAKTNGGHGTVVITGSGTGLTYDPVQGYHGIDTFTYTISDGLASDTATVRVTVVRDTAAPIVIAPAERFPGHTVSSTKTKARLTWSAADPGSGVKRYKLQVSVDGGVWKTIALPKATSKTIVRSLTTGHTYQFRVRAMDGEGNVSAYVKGPLLKPTRFSEASTRVTYIGAWAKTKTTKALGGATRHATASTKRARFTFTARDVGWIASTTTKSGKARIFIDGTLVATIDLDRTTTKYRKLVFARHFPTLAAHTLEIQPVGDGRVDIDGFVILR